MTMRQLLVRPPAVAGAFYPADVTSLADALHSSFAAGVHPDPDQPAPKALVVPHAGYGYSGPVAASAYLRLVPAGDKIRRGVLVGPSHYVSVDGIAATGAGAFATPFGPVVVDDAARQVALAHPAVRIDDRAHAFEHSLEVQLPFLQVVVDRFAVLPLAVGRCSASDAAAVLDALWGGPETVIVASSDLRTISATPTPPRRMRAPQPRSSPQMPRPSATVTRAAPPVCARF